MKIYIQTINFIKKYQPYSIYLLFIVFLISSFIEAIGISFVMPVIALVLDENFMMILKNSSFGKYIPEFILKFDRAEALLFFSILIISIYILKNIILVVTEYLKYIFINNIKEKISSLIMNKYLHEDYLYHSKKENSEMNSIVNQKISELTEGMLLSILAIVSELIMVVCLLILIIFFNQLNILLILILLFLVGIIISKFITGIIKRLGHERQHNVDIKFKNFTSIVNNFREILLTGKTGLYFLKFSNSLKAIAKLDAIRAALQRSPQLIFETLGIASLIIIIYYFLNIGASSTKIITVCTLFAAVCYRAIPSLHKILFYHYNIKYYKPIFDEILNEIKIENKTQYHSEKFKIKNNIELKKIFFKYDKDKDYVIKNLNIKIKLNSIIGVIGKSGSGKTTFLDIFSGLIVPETGSLIVDNQEISNNFLRRKFQNNISYISQKTTVINDILLKNICFGIDEKKIDFNKYNQVLEICELNKIEKNFDKSQKKISEFGSNISGGQLQRIGIARALYLDKEILIFDEATNALDEDLEKKIVSRIIKMKHEKILIFVSHNQDLLKNFDEIYELKNSDIIKIK